METKTYMKDGIEYVASNHRMVYNPEFHENHNKPFTKEDLIYMCSMWGSMKIKYISLALGRTEGTLSCKVYHLRKSGRFDYYRDLGKDT